jgi:hypothetical protein
MIAVLVAAMAACGDNGGVDTGPDAGPADAVVADAPDWFGEACTEAPWPGPGPSMINTTCRDGAGWCIDGRCRPSCLPGAADAPYCPAGGEMHYAYAGACYCTEG